MNDPRPSATPAKPQGRFKLILIGLVFLAPVVAAGILTLTGWQPMAKGNGLPISPQRSFETVTIQLAAGGQYTWRDSDPRLTLVALPGPACAARCIQQLTLMRNARITLNANADRLRLLYLGPAPIGGDADKVMPDWQVGTDVDRKLEAFRPTEPDSVAAVFVESNTTALAYYPAGFDPTGLRKDLQKVIK